MSVALEAREKAKAYLGLEGAHLVSDEGEYLLQRLISEHPISYLCRNEKNRQKFLCKVLTMFDLSEQNKIQLEMSISMLKNIRCENVLSPCDCFQYEDVMFMIFPYMGDETLLNKLMQRSRFSESDAAKILRQVAYGLQYLHSNNIDYHNIQPDTILCTDDLHVAIDGLTFVDSSDEVLRSVCGSLQYAAPEVLRHCPYTKASDIWSFGILTYILLTGSFAFQSNEYLPDLIMCGNYDRSLLKQCGVSKAACNFIAKLLSVDPRQRPTATEILNNRWLNGLPESDVVEMGDGAQSLGGLEYVGGSGSISDDI